MNAYQTEHLILTPMRIEHEAELFKLHNDVLIQETIFKNVPQTSENVRTWLARYLAQWQKNSFGVWMVYEKTKGGPAIIGRCGLQDFENTNNLEFSYAFLEYRAGRGLGPEAARFTITHALRNSTKEKVVGFIAHGNARAERAAKKLGLRYIDDRLYYDKLFQYYEMTREEYFSHPHHQVAR
ncbi:hypothetical protein CI1B_74260 [Bradyrhizobium ivorense]|uniref:N-acetyltransferase domain-containing protein n=1 Tax=Bradyrhizobium ivorense TaxID=2511166 RepID=A0A508TWP4_9BRAD|nr:GNAT family N-acetyltransferase [Bradyrhizobium ivorense]VIO78754.1 hypothetical protein CI1B_74260 [Bradyrhizobium ivorense]